MTTIGLAGGIGSGKTTIANALRARGYYVYDSDAAAKRIVLNPDVRWRIERLLGSDVYEGEQYLTRKVAERVFADTRLLQALNQIVHPAVLADLQHTKSQRQNDGCMFVESAILYESGLDRYCDHIVAVIAPKPLRIARTIARDGRSEEEVKQRIRSQMSNCQLRHRVDYVVENNGHLSIDQLTDRLVKRIIRLKWTASAAE